MPTEDPKGQVFRGQEGSGLAQVLRGPRVTPLDVLMQDAQQQRKIKELRDKERAQMSASMFSAMEKIKNDGWFKHRGSLEKSWTDGRREITDMFVKFGDNAFDRSTDSGRKNYARAHEIISNIKQQNSYSNQIKGYYDDAFKRLQSNPDEYTPESVQAFNSFYDLPFEQQLGQPLPQLQKKAEFVDWHKPLESSQFKEIVWSKDVADGDVIFTNAGKYLDERALATAIESKYANVNNPVVRAHMDEIESLYKNSGELMYLEEEEKQEKLRRMAIDQAIEYVKSTADESSKQNIKKKDTTGRRVEDITEVRKIMEALQNHDPKYFNILMSNKINGKKVNKVDYDDNSNELVLSHIDQDGNPIESERVSLAGEESDTWSAIYNYLPPELKRKVSLTDAMDPSVKTDRFYEVRDFKKQEFDQDLQELTSVFKDDDLDQTAIRQNEAQNKLNDIFKGSNLSNFEYVKGGFFTDDKLKYTENGEEKQVPIDDSFGTWIAEKMKESGVYDQDVIERDTGLSINDPSRFNDSKPVKSNKPGPPPQ